MAAPSLRAPPEVVRLCMVDNRAAGKRLKKALKKRVNPNALDERSWPLLCVASYFGCQRPLRVLLEHRLIEINKGSIERGVTALGFAWCVGLTAHLLTRIQHAIIV